MKKKIIRSVMFVLLLLFGYHSWSQNQTEEVNKDDLEAPMYKQTNSFVLRLDSIVQDSTSKLVFAYDSDGRMLLEERYSWYNGWVGSYRYEYSYTNSGHLDYEIISEWNNGGWEYYEKTEHYYDNNDYPEFYIRYFWDNTSNSWIPYTRNIFNYDSNGKILLQQFDHWNSSNNSWNPVHKTEYGYDNNGHRNLKIYYEWGDSITNDWVKVNKSEMSYDANGNLTEYISYVWDSNINDWIYDYKKIKTYNSSNDVISQTSFSWDASNNTWIGDIKYDYEYDSFGNTKLLVESHWNNNNWKYYKKTEWLYDANDYLLHRIEYYWSDYINDWKGHLKYENEYDSHNNLLSFTRSVDNPYDSTSLYTSWIYDYKYEYEYDANDNMTKAVHCTWNSSSNDWDYEEKYECFYDTDNNLILEYDYHWDDNINDWNAGEKYEYTYDTTISAEEIMKQEWTFMLLRNIWSYTYKRKIEHINSYYWSDSLNSFLGPLVKTYYYSQFNANDIVSLHSDNFLKIYPNPTKDFVIIKNYEKVKGSSFELFDATGKRVLIEKINDNFINLKGLNAGIYMYKVNDYRGKLIIN